MTRVDAGLDAHMMDRALREARKGRTSPNPHVGAIIARGNKVIAVGHHERCGGPHAEVVALERAGARARGATLYVTLEPCYMCAGAVVLARIPRLVYGARDPKAGACGSLAMVPHDLRLNHRAEVQPGVLAEECGALLESFFRSKRRGPV